MSRRPRGPLVRIARRWQLAEREATPEAIALGRRAWLRSIGAAGAGALALGALGCDSLGEAQPVPARQPPIPADVRRRYPAPRNARYTLDRPLTAEPVAARYNNFYELSTDKEEVAAEAVTLRTRPWTIEVRGLCQRPGTFDVDRLVRELPLEERLYRHRCVEAWAMAVPWTGFALSALLDRVKPYAGAGHVRFVSFHRPSEAAGQRAGGGYPWPYYEGLRMDEAYNELAFLATGIYGHPLPPQHGAPVRLVVPWKYGYKSIKSIVRIELVATEPRTFWSDIAPREYDFAALVNPRVPHPRWSQETERMLGTDERRPTQLFNGYAAEVAALYRYRRG